MSSTSHADASALAELENMLKIARDDFNAAIASIIDGLQPFDLIEQDEDGKRHVDKQALMDLLSRLDEAPEAVAGAFADYDWRVARAFRDLKRAEP